MNILFACESNTARSIMAEALLKRLGRGAFEVFSAGSAPGHHISAHIAETLKQAGYDTQDLRPKSWNEFVVHTAPRIDVVVTLSDGLKNGPFPIWYSSPVYVHWDFADPDAGAGGDDMTRRAVSRRLFSVMEQQLLKLTNLTLSGLGPNQLRAQLAAIAP